MNTIAPDYQSWTQEQWDAHKHKLADCYEKDFGYRPVKSKECFGCPSWPYAMCLNCYNETDKQHKEYASIYCGDEGDW